MARLKVDLDPKNHVIPGEDPEEFRQLVEEVEAQFPPGDLFERVLVEQVITNKWRLRRYQKILPYIQAKGEPKTISSLEKMISSIQRHILRTTKDITRQQAKRAKAAAKLKPKYPPLDDSLPPFYYIN